MRLKYNNNNSSKIKIFQQNFIINEKYDENNILSIIRNNNGNNSVNIFGYRIWMQIYIKKLDKIELIYLFSYHIFHTTKSVYYAGNFILYIRVPLKRECNAR